MTKKNKSLVPSRRPGAQPENRNALKHGFYARKMIPIELADLYTALGDGLVDEIALLRVVIRRVFNYADDHEQQTFETWSDCLNTLGIAGVRLASMVRTNAFLNCSKDALADMLLERANIIRQDHGFPDPRKPANAPA